MPATATIATIADYRLAYSLDEADDLGDGGTARITNALASAEDEVRSYVGQRYQLPSTPASAGHALKQAVLDIARFRLFDRRATDEVRHRYDHVKVWLRDVAKGLAILTDNTGQPLPSPAQASVLADPSAAASIQNSQIAVGDSASSATFGARFDAAFLP